MFLFVAVFCLWLAQHAEWIRKRHEVLDWLESRAPSYVSHGRAWTYYEPFDEHPYNNAPLSLRLFGELGMARIEIWEREDEEHPDYRLGEIESLFPEAEVGIVDFQHTKPFRPVKPKPAEKIIPGKTAKRILDL